jgi:hypothetical protein
MLPNLALIAATLGLLLIMFLIYREMKDEMDTLEKSSFGGGAVVVVIVAVAHILTTSGGGGH